MPGHDIVPTPHGSHQFSQSGLSALGQAREEKASIQAKAIDLASREMPEDIDALAQHSAMAQEDLEVQVATSVKGLSDLSDVVRAKTRACHQANWAYATPRDALTPNIWKTLGITYAVFWGETGMNTMVLSAEGKMSPADALIIAAIFSFVNITIAQLIGFLALRNMGYRLRPELEAEDPRPRKARRFGLIFLLVGLPILFVQFFAAARFRVNGSHEDVFSFERVSFLETFNDSIALLLIAIALVCAAINVLKGYSGYIEPLPGFAEPWKAVDVIDEEASAHTESSIEQIEDAAENAADIIEQTGAEIEEDVSAFSNDLKELVSEIHSLNAFIDTACRTEINLARSLHSAREFVPANADGAEAEIKSVFDALKIEETNLQPLHDKLHRAKGLLIRVEALRNDMELKLSGSIARIETAHGRYHTDRPLFDRTLIQ
ncbi:hypothetical protein [uncultured Roseobacter sp.]|uniref:hypothetical protein n=1 Tax=uncultured Roseobacter sp. TaxID=114847 RepID=UPI002621BB1D|nr:hypothetical protein [uncultured Roseobacter sp.]